MLTIMLKMSWTCALIDYSNSASGLEEMHLSYYYYLLKLLDLLDTVFFVLRKSYRQVSFLHTYHHCAMVLGIWVGVRFLPGGNGVWLPLLNCFVHVVMFIYYYLTAVSNKWKENVMFKKALTQLQLVLTRMLKMSWTCALIDYSNSASGLEDMHLSYYYYLLKLLDLLDTVFFVLRKSYRQVSFLHTYHHCGMVLAIWIGFRFLPGGNGGWIPLLNCAVHVVMFIYYYLTAASDKWKENVMFKKALTQLQLVQFAILLIVFGRIFFQPDCKYPIFVSYLFVPQNAFMMLLFGDFYLKAYVFKKINKSESINKKE